MCWLARDGGRAPFKGMGVWGGGGQRCCLFFLDALSQKKGSDRSLAENLAQSFNWGGCPPPPPAPRALLEQREEGGRGRFGFGFGRAVR